MRSVTINGGASVGLEQELEGDVAVTLGLLSKVGFTGP